MSSILSLTGSSSNLNIMSPLSNILVVPNYTHDFQFVKSNTEDQGEKYFTWIFNGALLLADTVEEISKEVFDNAKYFFQRCGVSVTDTDKNGDFLTYELESWVK